MTSSYTKHRSKIDLWLIILVMPIFILFLLSQVYRIAYGSVLGAIYGIILISLVVGPLLLIIPYRYTITNSDLIIQSGVLQIDRMQAVIPLSKITHIHETETWWISHSSAPWSMDRITIHYASGDKVAISPIRKMEFAEQLAEAANLVSDGNEWVKKEKV